MCVWVRGWPSSLVPAAWRSASSGSHVELSLAYATALVLSQPSQPYCGCCLEIPSSSGSDMYPPTWRKQHLRYLLLSLSGQPPRRHRSGLWSLHSSLLFPWQPGPLRKSCLILAIAQIIQTASGLRRIGR